MIKSFVKILTPFLLVSILLLVAPVLLHAQAPSEKRIEIQQRLEEKNLLLQQKREELQTNREERKASQAARLTERRRTIVQSQYQHMGLRIEAMINRLNILITRIESRVSQLEQEDGDLDTSLITADLEQAKLLTDEASANLVTVGDSLGVLLDSDDPRAVFKDVKLDVVEIKNNLKEVHRLLVKVIGDIKGLRVGQN